MSGAVIYRANVLLAESNATAEPTLQKMADLSPPPLPAAIGAELVRLDSPNIAGEARTPNLGGRLPTTFIGCPRYRHRPGQALPGRGRCRPTFFQTADHAPEAVTFNLAMFGEEVLPRIRHI